MKLFFFMVLASFSMNSFACSPAPILIAQTGNLARVLASEEFKNELQKNMDDFSTSIDSFTFGSTVNANLSNGCVIESALKYKAPEHQGLCPRFIGVTSVTVCN